MNVPLQITMRDMPPSEALDTRIRQYATKLEKLHSRITSCRVTIGPSEGHSHQGRQFDVCIDVRAPGHEEAVSTLKHHEDVYVALRDAFDATRRQLDDAARIRGDVSAPPAAR